MKTIIATEAVNITEGKITLQHPATNFDNSPAILNKGFVFNISSQQWLPVIEDTSDEEQKTWIVGTDEDLEGVQVLVQYTILTDSLLSGINNPTVIGTDIVTLDSNKVTLRHAPWNPYGGCPILTAGYGVVKTKESSLIYLPTSPNPEDIGGNTILIPLSDEQFKELELEGCEFAIQYLYEAPSDIEEETVICTETVTISDGKFTLTDEPSNVLDESPFLNLGIVATIADEENNVIQFMISKVEGNVCEVPDISEDEINALEGKQIVVQYTKTVPVDRSIQLTEGVMNAADIGITPEMIAEAKAKAESGTPSDVDMSQFEGMMTSDQLGVDPEMLRKARQDSNARDGDSFTGSILETFDDEDDIVDGEFTEVIEEEPEQAEPATTTWSE